MTATQVFDGFGETVSTSGSTPTYGYCGTSGYRDDGDAGLTHVGARYYDASVGRFITRDTDLTQKPYTYCEGDPINDVDPTGHTNSSDYWNQGNGWQIAGGVFVLTLVGIAIFATAPFSLTVLVVAGGLGAAGGAMVGWGTHLEQQSYMMETVEAMPNVA